MVALTVWGLLPEGVSDGPMCSRYEGTDDASVGREDPCTR